MAHWRTTTVIWMVVVEWCLGAPHGRDGSGHSGFWLECEFSMKELAIVFPNDSY